jgi:hypothetical protein
MIQFRLTYPSGGVWFTDWLSLASITLEEVPQLLAEYGCQSAEIWAVRPI